MNASALQSIHGWFRAYADGYRQADGSLHPALQFKFDHTLRVASDCAALSRDLAWPEAEIRTAEALGVMHDVGRFPQFVEYGTYSDAESCNHGERGWQIVREAGVLGENGYAESLLGGIRFHNRRDLPAGINPEGLRFLRLIRDADKLDIFRTVVRIVNEKPRDCPPWLLMNVDPDGPATPELVREILEQGAGSYRHVHSLADMSLMRVAWVAGVNYLPTLRRLVADRLLEDLDAGLTDDPGVRAIRERAQTFIAEKLAAGVADLRR
jgi:hypothetical protein